MNVVLLGPEHVSLRLKSIGNDRPADNSPAEGTRWPGRHNGWGYRVGYTTGIRCNACGELFFGGEPEPVPLRTDKGRRLENGGSVVCGEVSHARWKVHVTALRAMVELGRCGAADGGQADRRRPPRSRRGSRAMGSRQVVDDDFI